MDDTVFERIKEVQDKIFVSAEKHNTEIDRYRNALLQANAFTCASIEVKVDHFYGPVLYDLWWTRIGNRWDFNVVEVGNENTGGKLLRNCSLRVRVAAVSQLPRLVVAIEREAVNFLNSMEAAPTC